MNPIFDMPDVADLWETYQECGGGEALQYYSSAFRFDANGNETFKALVDDIAKRHKCPTATVEKLFSLGVIIGAMYFNYRYQDAMQPQIREDMTSGRRVKLERAKVQ